MNKSPSPRTNPLITAISKEAGFADPLDAIFCAPVRYDDPPPPITLATDKTKLSHHPQTFLGKIVQEPMQISIMPPIFSFYVLGSSGNIYATGSGLIDKKNIAGTWRIGQEVSFTGLWLTHGVISNVMPATERPLTSQYKAKGKGFSKTVPQVVNATFASFLQSAINRIKTAFDDADDSVIMAYLNHNLGKKSFGSLQQFFLSLHFPRTEDESQLANKAAINLAAVDCCYRAKRASYRQTIKESAIEIPGEIVAGFSKRLPFPLSEEQRSAIRDAWNDLKRPVPMNRLLSGDVGTGKTAVIGVIAASAQHVGKRVVIFTPNGLLTDQLFNEINSWFPEISVEKVTKDIKPSAIHDSQNPILIGTHAVLRWAKTNNYYPDLLIVDEQQKSSREQRETLLKEYTNFLEATATCIPRTFGLMVYGGMKVSVIRQHPVKKSITTKVLFNDDRSLAFDHIRETVSRGDKVAIILPLAKKKNSDDIDPENDKLSVESAIKIWEKTFPGSVIGLHGKMPEAEKIAKLNSIKNDTDKSIILATSIIEIGVTIKNLRVLMVVEPDRYGLSTLHQMRGRLARNGGSGTMYLLLKKPLEKVPNQTIKRLATMEKIFDGFLLTESDAAMRGWGDLAEDSDMQAGSVITLFRNILIPQATISDIQKMFESKEGQLS